MHKKIVLIISIFIIIYLVGCVNAKEEPIKSDSLTVHTSNIFVSIDQTFEIDYENPDNFEITYLYDSENFNLNDNYFTAINIGLFEIEIVYHDTFSKIVKINVVDQNWYNYFIGKIHINQIAEIDTFTVENNITFITLKKLDLTKLNHNFVTSKFGDNYIEIKEESSTHKIVIEVTTNKMIILKNDEVINYNQGLNMLNQRLNESFDFSFALDGIYKISNLESNHTFEIESILGYQIDIESILKQNEFIYFEYNKYINIEADLQLIIHENKLNFGYLSSDIKWAIIQKYLFDNYELLLPNVDNFTSIETIINLESSTRYTYHIAGIENAESFIENFISNLTFDGYELLEGSDSHLGNLVNYDFEEIVISYHESHGDEPGVEISITFRKLLN